MKNNQMTPIGTMSSGDVITNAIRHVYPRRIAAVSSFGTEAGVLLHLLSRVSTDVPVIFIDTGKHFPETLVYKERLIRRLGLTNVLSISPASEDIAAEDPNGLLWQEAPNACCAMRKVRPFAIATARYDALITGRKRHHGMGRETVGVLDASGRQVKINPLYDWTSEDISTYMDRFGLPRHPLQEQGYPSIGCAVCTSKAGTFEGFRAGRWRGKDKAECGIHLI